MCLISIDEQPNGTWLSPEKEGTGYKIFKVSPINGKLCPAFSSTIENYQLRRWYEATRKYITVMYRPSYLSGFHICKKFPEEYANRPGLHIYKVKYRGASIQGIDGTIHDMPTVVADEMLILDKVSE